jgi:dihydrofolate synthase/folylpolyglutamate synthase
MRPQSDALAYLDARILHGVKFGLETVQQLLEALDHPERASPMLLVAGTNGKGSVVAYVDAALRASGLRVGRYTSPHLMRLNERIAVDDRDIADLDLETCVLAVRDCAEDLRQRGVISDHPTYFEALTVAAFEHFRRSGVGLGVIEIGMGGRLDAANSCDPIASAIVTIAFDHERFLGHTLTAIAREKAGVLRRGHDTVIGRLPAEAEAAIRDEAERLGARLVHADYGIELTEQDGLLDVRTPKRDYRGLRALAGAHQRDNLLVALRLLESAEEAGVRFDPSALPAALARARWPGRLEWVDAEPRVLLDGAHNPAAAVVLADYLAHIGPFVLVFGAMRDKDIAGLAQALFPLAREVVLSQPSTARAATPDEIVARSGALAARACALARELARPGEPVVVAGSLYLVGEVRAQLMAEGHMSDAGAATPPVSSP